MKTDRYKQAIKASGLDIYSPIAIGDEQLWVPTPQLERLLTEALQGTDWSPLALRTRSKMLKVAVCNALGYPVPASFRHTHPRFPGQQLDAFSQKSRNLQVWNQHLDPDRRYAIVQLSPEGIVTRVKVVDGRKLAALDKTGTVTQKFQARLVVGAKTAELASTADSSLLLPHLSKATTTKVSANANPLDPPKSGELFSIESLYKVFASLVGQSVPDPGPDQDRNRGAGLHALACQALGYRIHADNGQFPDIPHQLLETKLQTSPTIDLGRGLPDSASAIKVPPLGATQPTNRDARFLIVYGKSNGARVTISHVIVVNGADFFKRLPRFKGNIVNGKLQIPLPTDFFD